MPAGIVRGYLHLRRMEMKRLFKKLGITVIVTVIWIFLTGCPVEGEGIELGNYGGKTMSEAYHLTDGEYVMGFLPKEEDSRWFSVPVVANRKFDIYFYKDSILTDDVIYYVYYQSGKKIWSNGYSGRSVYTFTPVSTGTWYFEVTPRYSINDAFAIAYTTGDNAPTRPTY